MADFQILTNKRSFQISTLAILLIVCLTLVYSNHFHNDFQFDDSHTIVNNVYIRDLSNIPAFFKDNSMMSSYIGNRSYRPVVTTLNAIDYSIGGLDPYYFHVSIFISYILLLILLFIMIRNILRMAFDQGWADWIALFSTTFYGFHTANAETVNYIISRSDSFSTLCLVATLVMFQNQFTRKWMLYLIPLVIGILTKQVGVVTAPILFLYVFLFEEELSLGDAFKKNNFGKLWKSFVKVLPVLLVAITLFLFNQMVLTKGASANLMQTTSTNRWDYFTTQWYIMAHYMGNFILPINLSADPDIKIIESLFDIRKIIGFVIIAFLLYVAYRSSKNKAYRGITFGILWYYIALAPTSSFHTLGQISNDHRTFLPYIGLIIALATYLGQVVYHRRERWMNPQVKILLSLVFVGLIAGHAYGVRHRNEVWRNGETLWKDVAEKSPENGRGLMNHGLTLMKHGDFTGALDYFKRAGKIMPHYSFLEINMGILKNAMGDPDQGEVHFKKALRMDPGNVETYYFYARFLVGQGRNASAKELIQRGLSISPGHTNLQRFQQQLANLPDVPSEYEGQYEALTEGKSVNEYINKSLDYYNHGLYDKVIEACQLALKVNPNSSAAYNNMCIAYIRLNRIDEAIEAEERALQIDPDFQLAKNNLAWARSLKGK